MTQTYAECSCDFLIPIDILFFDWDQIYTDIHLAIINKNDSIQAFVSQVKQEILKRFPFLAVTVEAKDVKWLRPRVVNFVPGITVAISHGEIDELSDKLNEIMSEVYEKRKWVILMNHYSKHMR